jgi:hypothetical protein
MDHSSSTASPESTKNSRTSDESLMTVSPEAGSSTRECVPQWTWPLTHQKRIAELEDYMKKNPCKIHHDDINAAIQYHQSFPQNELCSPKLVHFQYSQIVEIGKLDGWAPVWTEVSIRSKTLEYSLVNLS